jgi:hypothetical protein
MLEKGTAMIVAQRNARRTRAGLWRIPVAVVALAAAAAVSAALVPGTASTEGRVRLDGHAFADDAGPFNALGASLFWGLWGERHDAERLDANLAHLAEHDVDYVRVLAMVGARTWEDRVIDPAWPDYWTIVDHFFERLARHGLRAQVTLFADAQVMMPSAVDRDRFVDAWASRLEQWGENVLFVEVANEHWQNGLPDPDELHRRGQVLRRATSVPVALSAPRQHEVAAVYTEWPSVATMHFDRSLSGPLGALGPIAQPWRWPESYFDPATLAPPAFVNAEPIGPDSSVAQDDDPARIALAYVMTFLAGGAAYTYHPGAGVRGGGAYDSGIGRHANLFDYDPHIISALSHWRRTLPPGLANGERRSAEWQRPRPELPWTGLDVALEDGTIAGAYASVLDDRVIAVVLGIERPVRVRARWAIDLQLLDPATGAVVDEVRLSPGESWELPANQAGYVIDATRR